MRLQVRPPEACDPQQAGAGSVAPAGLLPAISSRPGIRVSMTAYSPRTDADSGYADRRQHVRATSPHRVELRWLTKGAVPPGQDGLVQFKTALSLTLF